MGKIKKKVELQFFKTKDPVSLPSIPKKLKTRILRKGDLHSNGKTVSRHNSVEMTKKYPEGSEVDEIINKFISKFLAGSFYQEMREKLEPETAFLRVHIPAKSSKLIQDFFIEKNTLKLLIEMELDLDIWFS